MPVSRKTLRPNDAGRLLRALLPLVERWGGEGWTEQVRYLGARLA